MKSVYIDWSATVLPARRNQPRHFFLLLVFLVRPVIIMTQLFSIVSLWS